MEQTETTPTGATTTSSVAETPVDTQSPEVQDASTENKVDTAPVADPGYDANSVTVNTPTVADESPAPKVQDTTYTTGPECYPPEVNTPECYPPEATVESTKPETEVEQPKPAKDSMSSPETPVISVKPAPKTITVSVNNHEAAGAESAPGNRFDNRRDARSDWKTEQAKRHARQQTAMIKSGYSPTATLAIMRFSDANRGYSSSNAKDTLISMYVRFSRSLKYKLDYFNRDMSSLFAIMLIDINGRLVENHELFHMPEVESREFILKTIDDVWRHNSGNADHEFMRLKQQFQSAMLLMIETGYAARAVMFIESIIDTTMKMIDPFEGMFHDDVLEIPDDIRKIFKMPPRGMEGEPRQYHKKEWPKVICQRCNSEMKYIKSMKKHVCTNTSCIDFVDVPPLNPRPGYGEGHGKYQKRPRNFDSPQGYRPPRTFVAAPDGGKFGNDAFASALNNVKVGD